MPHTLVSAVLIAVAVLTPKLVSAEPSQIAVRIDESGGVIVPVTINGSGPFPFLLDTGATRSVISRSLADRFALRFVAKTEVLTSTGREWRPVVALDETSIGDVRAEGLLASVAPSAQLDAIARGLEGIVGQDFLFALNYTLDYRRQRLVWTADDTADGSMRIPLVAQEGRYLARIPVRGNDTPMLLVPDSGANGFVMFSRNGRTRVALDGTTRMTSVHSVSGRQDVRAMTVRELRVGNVTFRNQPVAVIVRDKGDALEGDGLLPLHLFASVSFNAREQCLVLRPYAE